MGAVAVTAAELDYRDRLAEQYAAAGYCDPCAGRVATGAVVGWSRTGNRLCDRCDLICLPIELDRITDPTGLCWLNVAPAVDPVRLATAQGRQRDGRRMRTGRAAKVKGRS